MNVIKNGEKKQMSYEEICKELGFIAKCKFVNVTTRGTITFYVATPDEVRALYKSVLDCGFKPAASLTKTIRSLYW